MSIAASVSALRAAKAEIAEAIENKGVPVGAEDGYSTFAARIAEIAAAAVIPSNYGLVTFTAIIPTAANIMIT